MNSLNSKEYKLYANFLNTLAKDLNKFYYSKLNKTFKISNKLRVKVMTLSQLQIKHLKNL